MRTLQHTFKVIYLSTCFALFFLAYLTAQSFATTLHKDIGFYALAILYGVFGIFSPLAPTMANYINNPKITLFLSSAIYIVWVVVSVQSDGVGFLIISAFVGFAGSFVWNQMGQYLNQLSEDTKDPTSIGYYMGLFFSIFGTSSVFGNIIGTAYLQSGGDIKTLFWIIAGIGSIGVIGFLFLPSSTSAPKVDDMSVVVAENCDKPVENINEISTFERLKDSYDLQMETPMLFLSVYFTYYGFTTAYIFTKFPLIIALNDIPSVFLSWSVASCISPFFSGAIFANYGSFPTCLIQVSCLAVAHIYYASGADKTFVVHVIMAFLLGISDAFVNALASTYPSNYYGDRSNRVVAAGFGISRLYYSAGTVICSFVAQAVEFQVMSIIILITIPFAMTALYIFLITVKPEPINIVKTIEVKSPESVSVIEMR